MKRLTDEELTAIRERAEKASTSPWITEEGEFSGENWLIAYTGADIDGKEYYITTDRVHGSDLEGNPKDDAVFIAHAREDIPKLIVEIEELEKDLLELVKQNKELRKSIAFYSSESYNAYLERLLDRREQQNERYQEAIEEALKIVRPIILSSPECSDIEVVLRKALEGEE